MPQTATEIAKDLAIAAIHAQPQSIAPRAAGPGDERTVGQEAAQLYLQILNVLRSANVT
jgi:hypothetical protein